MRVEISRLHKELGDDDDICDARPDRSDDAGRQIVVLRGGNIEQIGAPLDLYDDPANQFVAGFVGSPKMNFMKAEIIEATDHSGRSRF